MESISRHITSLVINSLGGGDAHTRTHTHTHMHTHTHTQTHTHKHAYSRLHRNNFLRNQACAATGTRTCT